MSILNQIRRFTQRNKRQDLLNRYGFYETSETQKGKLIGDDMLGGVSVFTSKYTTFHIHTMLDCPFLIKPHDEDETEYSCQLLLPNKYSYSYNIEMKELISLLENKYTDSDRFMTFLSLSHYHCQCMEWTKHIKSFQ